MTVPWSSPAALIDTERQLEQLVEQLSAASVIGLDTEANGFHAYRPRLCLLQVAWADGATDAVALIDTLAFARRPLALAGLLASTEPQKIVHGADYDVRLIKRDLDVPLHGLIDTQIAARLLGEEKTGLAAVTASMAGIELDKGGQRIDWARRPLSARALSYAARDAAVLLALWREMQPRLRRAGRLAWAYEESLVLEQVPAAGEPAPDLDALTRRIGARTSLDGKGWAVLRALVGWRDREARRRDVPAVHVLGSQPLVVLARRTPGEARELKRIRLPANVRKQHGEHLLAVVREAIARGAAPAKRARPQRPEGIEARLLGRLRHQRDVRARALGLEPAVLCSNATLRELARLRPAHERQLLEAGMRAWQAEQLGEAILAALKVKR
ncbi:MAG: HRDC domain-containing protein [Acidobacteriota bacterium]|nr:MAG: HRDC domain-containing protein [Acidobacteriota bacterium]